MPLPDAEVLARVPHRAPILRVHHIVAVDGNAATVLGCEPDGPGALPWAAGAIEGIAQSAAILLGHGHAPGVAPPRGMLVAVRSLTAPKSPPPGATITYRVELVRRLGPTARVRGRAECDGQLLAAGELTLWSALPG